MVARSAGGRFFRFDTTNLGLAIDRTPKNLANRLRKAFDEHGFLFENKIRDRFKASVEPTGLRRNLTKTLIAVRSGKTRNSIGHRVNKARKPSNVRLFAFIGGSGFPGILKLERGGIIRGRPWLTIPLSDNLTAAGRVRFARARDVPNSALINIGTAGDPQLFIISKLKRRSRPRGSRRTRTGGSIRRAVSDIRWMFILKRSVELKPRLRFFATWNSRAMRRDRADRMNRAVRLALLDLNVFTQKGKAVRATLIDLGGSS